MDSKRVVAFRPAARVGVLASSLALLAMLVSSNPALAADTRIGAPVGDLVDGVCTLSVDTVQASTNPTTSLYVVPSTGGSITSWNSLLIPGMTGLLGLEVWRLFSAATPISPAFYTLVGATPTVPAGSLTAVAIPVTPAIAVLPGDLIGMRMDGLVACGTRTGAALDVWANASGATPAPLANKAFDLPNSAGRLNIWATVTTTVIQPPPPPTTGCDSTGNNTGTDACVQH